MYGKNIILVFLILFIGCVKDEVIRKPVEKEITISKFKVSGSLTQLNEFMPYQRLSLKIYNKTYDVTTDENGNFSLDVVYSGPSELLISYVNSIGDTRSYRKYFSTQEDHKLLINIDKNGSLKASNVN